MGKRSFDRLGRSDACSRVCPVTSFPAIARASSRLPACDFPLHLSISCLTPSIFTTTSSLPIHHLFSAGHITGFDCLSSRSLHETCWFHSFAHSFAGSSPPRSLIQLFPALRHHVCCKSSPESSQNLGRYFALLSPSSIDTHRHLHHNPGRGPRLMNFLTRILQDCMPFPPPNHS